MIPFQVPQVPDSLLNVRQELGSLKNMSFDDLVNQIVEKLINFAISLAIAILVFYVGRFIIRKIYGFIHKIMTKRKVDTSLTTFVLSLVNIVLYFILVVTVIGILGIETSSFIAIFASAGVALGMALSGTLQNFAGGVLILLLKPYKVGDFIEVQGFSGTVKEIQIFNTVINTGDNKYITIPNGGLSTGSINNYSKESFRRVDWTISISYGDDVENARKSILDIIRSDARVIANDDPAQPGRGPVVYLNTLGASSVDLTVRAWVKSADYWGVYFGLNERFYAELPSKGVNFPFPQLDVHLTKQ